MRCRTVGPVGPVLCLCLCVYGIALSNIYVNECQQRWKINFKSVPLPDSGYRMTINFTGLLLLVLYSIIGLFDDKYFLIKIYNKAKSLKKILSGNFYQIDSPDLWKIFGFQNSDFLMLTPTYSS